MQKGDRVYNWSTHEYAEVIDVVDEKRIRVQYDNDLYASVALKYFFHAVEDHQK